MAGETMEEECRTLTRVIGTVRKMLRARGYELPTPEFETWQALKRLMEEGRKKDSFFIVAERPAAVEGQPNERIVVLFAEEPKIQSKEARKYLVRMEKVQATRAILVVDESVTGSVRTALTSLPSVRVELFLTAELIIDITEHELVPDHVVLTEDEKKLVLKRYNLNESQLPRMFTTDPISRYFGLSRGNVVKIIRSSETAGRYVTYRIVMDA